MVVIRLARFGSKHRPKYRVTVADQRRAATGKYIEIVGNFNPSPQGQEKEIILDLDRVNSWIAKGAQPTQRVKSIIKKAQAGA
ncbi:MAG: 30S ribosomal protein S16 [Bdellovibrionaceae bacterium]|nr:30S ribosomal protein S16 [Pseudobdellovibrionaceae bacterium]|tara:strand:- start:99993 stop:100241 length:249 start_codon:yes stop_codon:yes gene_type:complete